MYKICIVGGGQIGSRHLQGLAPVNLPVEIFVVDPSQKSLDTAQQRLHAVASREFVEKVHYLKSLEGLPDVLDLCIVATNSHVRYGVMNFLLRSRDIKNYVLEKVVFQSSEQFEEMLPRIEFAGARAWVNCPRRMYPGYHDLKQRLAMEKRLHIEVAGGDWGLGCNAIHYLDLLAYLSDSADYTIDSSQLEPRIYPSKRDGYVEFSGTLTAQLHNGNKIFLISKVGSDSINRLVFKSEKITVVVDEVGRKIEWSSSEQSGDADIVPFESRFQSQLTYQFAQDILRTETCSLPTLEESSRIHKPLLDAFLQHLNRYSDEFFDHCPIT